LPSAAKPKYTVEAEKVGTETRGVITAAYGKKNVVGTLRFVDYAGTTQIRLILVDEEHRREGVATGLIATLREYLPASKPAQFLMTPDAKALRDAIYDEYARPLAR
jgi:GNAT superfamily N-acetyltransferase